MRASQVNGESAVLFAPRWGPGVAQELLALAGELVEAEHQGLDLAELVGRALAVGAEVEHYLGAAVHDARERGASWGDVAREARVSEATARAKWGARTLRRQMRRRAENAVAPVGTQAEAERHPGAPSHRQKLSAALSFLLRAHGGTAQSLARQAGVSPSCVSRLLAGQRVPDWPTVFTVVTAAGGRPEEFRLLWEWARGVQQLRRGSAAAALARFHGALRGLQWAAGTAYDGGEQDGEPVSDAGMIEAVLSGDLVPDWETTHRIVQHLGGTPAQLRPLWEDVQYAFVIAHDFFPAQGVPGASELA
ncbi:XRE family transcriptional regulator [Streptomyces sp. NBC_00986]|uniref:XRE family transcriptional regulator n=1 Tax=Streptomyces sp. NBC_00986 TaxID=2903702 RepID=UPI00386BA04D|nr:helix-turn-helix domain-containing protein [Streptomyces sp. NBC_00986]